MIFPKGAIEKNDFFIISTIFNVVVKKQLDYKVFKLKTLKRWDIM